MAASAAFHFDSQASLLKKSATPGGTVTCTLDSVTGVDSILWSISLECPESHGDWAISGTTANGATVTVPNALGVGCIIQCRVNGGTRVDPTTGVQSVGDLVKSALIYTFPEPLITGETTQSDSADGWGPKLNMLLRGFQQKIHTADGTLIVNGTNILTSAADGMTIPLAASYPGQALVIINDMAATNATMTASGSDTIAGGTSSTTYVLAFGAPGVVTLLASADTTANKWYAVPRL